jgi:hypothetical protein
MWVYSGIAACPGDHRAECVEDLELSKAFLDRSDHPRCVCVGEGAVEGNKCGEPGATVAAVIGW